MKSHHIPNTIVETGVAAGAPGITSGGTGDISFWVVSEGGTFSKL